MQDTSHRIVSSRVSKVIMRRMRIHILGVCGTFMGGIAALAKAEGHTVSGSDRNVYPPMSTQLEALGIPVVEGYDPAQLEPPPDCLVVGNVMTRGNAVIEHMLNAGLRYTSGPEWLAAHVLARRWVLAVAGTHGKTTTASMLAWILEHAGRSPGFLIGGVPQNFGVSARLGGGEHFVVEADEYDTAFFDKRSKFVHYRPRTLVLTNLEYDHADIFPDLAAIQRQFHHLIRTVPGGGSIIAQAGSHAIDEVLAMGCWTPLVRFGDSGGAWRARGGSGDGFEVVRDGEVLGEVRWQIPGAHNRDNAVAAIAAASHAGVPVSAAIAALARFQGVKRRLELRAEIGGIRLYDDFAHHPTEITASLAALRTRAGSARLIAVFEPRSHSMKLGAHRAGLAEALGAADGTWLYQPPNIAWSLEDVAAQIGAHAHVAGDIDSLVHALTTELRAGDHVAIMSNGGFGGLHIRLEAALRARGPKS
jgi:UDP-N-acetylmuramate: L-alanyl-gamma-D-glutamyl-meso-diaminopimelate ligase